MDFKHRDQRNLEECVADCFKAVKESFRGSLDQSGVQLMRDCWEQASERFKQFNLGRHQKQALKDAQTWLSQRLDAKL